MADSVKKEKITLCDGHRIEKEQLGKLHDGTIIDFSPLSHGGKARTLSAAGKWIEAGDLAGRGRKAFTPLREEDYKRLTNAGIIK